MTNINYKLTLQDDLDNLETDSEYKFNLPWFKWLIIKGGTASLFLLGLFVLIEGIVARNDPNANWGIIMGIISIIFGCIYPFLFKPALAPRFNRRELQKRWSKKISQEEFRNITLTETEFIFEKDFAELAWKWKAFKTFFEGNKGFLLWFYSEDYIYIPKRIFKNQEETDTFKDILHKYNKVNQSF